jgi:hypothetical protein
LDDIDGLYRDRNGARLLKSLCQTEPIKTVSWNTDAASLHREGIPKEFTTNSRVAIIANDWDSSNVNVAALEDRGHAIEFVPSSLEVHREAATWFWDQEIFDFVADHLHLIERPSLRTYVLAYELKNSNLDWKGGVMSRSLQGAALEVAKLKADTSYSSEEARVQAFIAAGEGCRATYFNYAKRLRDVSPIPKVELVNTRPPKLTVSSDQDLVDLLRKRFGQLGNG